MNKKAILLIFLLGSVFSAFAQKPGSPARKTYQVWIKLKDNALTTNGILYEISDSSLFISNSVFYPNEVEFRYHKIDLLKIRRTNSVLRGSLTGGAIGVATGVIMVNTVEGGLGFMTIPVSTFSGLIFGLFGAGIGCVAGTIKDRLPVKGSFENFSKYKGSLLDYSWTKEQITASRFQHRGYFGAEGGVSLASGEFTTLQNIPLAGYIRMVKTGSAMVTQGGYRFTPYFGVNLALINNMYSLELDQSAVPGEYSPYWGFDALIISPVVSLPFHSEWKLDFSPGIGYAGTTLSGSEDFVLNGEGFAVQLKGSLSWNYTKRWTASLGTGYLSSKITYKEGGTGTARAFNLTAGVAYLFGKKSL
jgi:hypothetical protein